MTMEATSVQPEVTPLCGNIYTGIIILIGDTRGTSYCFVIDTTRKNLQKILTDSTLAGEEVVGIHSSGDGAIKATYDGRVSAVRSFSYYNDPKITEHKGLLGE